MLLFAAADLSPCSPPWKNGFNESEVRRVAAALISTGMASKGFVYLNLDCGWSTGYRSKDGKLQVSTKLFPSAAGGKGLRPLAEHLHSLKLKLGIYTSGHQCCSPKDGTDGSEGKESEDAQQFAAWGIDCMFLSLPTLIMPSRSVPRPVQT